MIYGTLDVRLVLGVTGLCTALYKLLCCLFPQRSCEWHCRSVTMLHAVTVTLMGLWCAFVQGPWPFTEAGGPNTPLQVIIISICLGYFLFDFGWCIIFLTEGPTMMMHHSLSIVGLTWSLVAGKYGTEMVATIIGTEVSNPLLQLRWYLRETQNYNTIVGEIVDVLFMTTFGGMRIGLGSYLLYCYYQQPTDFYGRLGGTCIYLISWAFWVNIVQFAIRKYTKMFRRWQGRSSTSTEAQPSVSSSPPHSQARNPARPWGSVDVSPGENTSRNAVQVGSEIDSKSTLGGDLVSQGESSSGGSSPSQIGSPTGSSEVFRRKAAAGVVATDKAEAGTGGGIRFNGLLTCQNGGGVVEQMLHDVESVVSSSGIASKKDA